jgi:hypothetical protein
MVYVEPLSDGSALVQDPLPLLVGVYKKEDIPDSPPSQLVDPPSQIPGSQNSTTENSTLKYIKQKGVSGEAPDQ